MKRVLVVLLALVMGAGLVFAADQAPPKWTWWAEGDFILWDQDGQAYLGPSWDSDLNLGQYTTMGLTYAEKDFGFSFISEFDSDNIFGGVDPALNSNSLRNMSAWYSLFNGMLKVTAGKVRNGDYRPTSYIEGTSVVTRILNAEWGFLAQVMPVKNLSVGVAAKFVEGPAAQDYADMLGFGVSYAVDGIGTFYLNGRTMDSGTSPAMLENAFGGAVKLTAIKILPMVLSFQMNLYDVNDPQFNVLFSTQYVMGAMTAAVDAKFVYQTQFDYAIEALVKYSLNPTWVVGANLGYATISYFTYGSAGLFVLPWVQANIGSASSLRLGFVLDTEYSATESTGLLWNIPFRYIISF